MITIVVVDDKSLESLYGTIDSFLSNNTELFKEVSVRILNFKSQKIAIEKYSSLNIVVEKIVNGNVALSMKKMLESINSEYVLFIHSGNKVSTNFFEGIKNSLQSQSVLKEGDNEISSDLIIFNKKNQNKYALEDVSKKLIIPSIIDLEKTPNKVPLTECEFCFKVSSLKKVGINENLKFDVELYSLYRILVKNSKQVFVKNIFCYTDDLPKNQVDFDKCLDREWYFNAITDFMIPLIKIYKEECGELPVFMHCAILSLLSQRFINNVNNGNKHVIDDEVDEYFNLCHKVLEHIDLKYIANQEKKRVIELPKMVEYVFLHLKYKGTFKCKYLYTPDDIYTFYENVSLERFKAQVINIELMDYVENEFIIEGFIDNLIDFDNVRLLAFVDDEPWETEVTYRYGHYKFFGRSVHKRHTFRVKIPKEYLDTSKNHKVYFKIGIDDRMYLLKARTIRYTSRVSSSLPGSFWRFDDQLVRFVNRNKALQITKPSKKHILKSNIILLMSILKKNKKAFALRIVYNLSKPFFRKKRIWLTYDKLYKGGDCGEYFYRYADSVKDDVVACYVINKDSNDYCRLKNEGYKPLAFGSIRHLLYFLNSEVVFTTHGGVHNFNGFRDDNIIYFQDMLHFDVACIQHGLTVQQLAFNSNRVFNNMKRYYCASKYEIANLSKPIYGYEDKSMLRLTGIPRYDGLKNDDKQQILITPTWRNYIAMPAAAKNAAKPYFEGFKNTDYFKIYNRLLTDEKLIKTAKENNYKLIYLLHPVISCQIDDYPQNENVSIVQASDVNYETILRQSSLMLTDYSGVQFDFAYMRKPVVYYHPPELPPHYKEGGFFYDTMGFGEICENHEQIVEALCYYMKNECKVKPFYMERQNDFFAYSDFNNCKRIYDDMYAYQEIKHKKKEV